MECIVLRILQPNYENKVLERAVPKLPFQDGSPIQRGDFRWSTSVKRAPCGCPFSPGARGFAHPEPIGVTPLVRILSQPY